ncbi:hypothetical protein ACJX0J_026283 [Zea mays]
MCTNLVYTLPRYKKDSKQKNEVGYAFDNKGNKNINQIFYLYLILLSILIEQLPHSQDTASNPIHYPFKFSIYSLEIKNLSETYISKEQRWRDYKPIPIGTYPIMEASGAFIFYPVFKCVHIYF